MPRLRRHRQSFAQRLLVLVLFALSMVLQPVLASVSEIHELAHDLVAGHVHVDHADETSADVAPNGQDDGPAAALHMLMHFAHCCGQSPAATVPATFAMPMRTAATAPPVRGPQRVTSARMLAPYRPPITA